MTLTREQVAERLETPMQNSGCEGESHWVIDTVLAMVAEELAELEQRHERLRRAINESGDFCTDECDSYGHSEQCRTSDAATWLVNLQARAETAESQVAALRFQLKELFERSHTLGEIQRVLADTAAVAAAHDARIGDAALEKAENVFDQALAGVEISAHASLVLQTTRAEIRALRSKP